MNQALTGPSLALDLPNGAYFERFGIGQEVLQKVLSAALAMGADDCDLYFEHRLSTSVALTDGKVNRASTGVDLGLGVRSRKGDAIGYSYTEDLSLEAMLSAARTAAAAKFGLRCASNLEPRLGSRRLRGCGGGLGRAQERRQEVSKKFGI